MSEHFIHPKDLREWVEKRFGVNFEQNADLWFGHHQEAYQNMKDLYELGYIHGRKDVEERDRHILHLQDLLRAKQEITIHVTPAKPLGLFSFIKSFLS
jgi:hypothetical protein